MESPPPTPVLEHQDAMLNETEEIDEVAEQPPQKKKRTMTPKQLAALEAGRAKRREAQLAKTAARRAELEALKGVEEQKGETEEETKKIQKPKKKAQPAKNLSTIEEKLDALIDREMKKSAKQPNQKEDNEEEDSGVSDDEEEEEDSMSEDDYEVEDEEEEEEEIQKPTKKHRSNTSVHDSRKVTTPAMSRLQNEVDKYRRYLNRPELKFV